MKGFCESIGCGKFRSLHKNRRTKMFICVQCRKKDPLSCKICCVCKILKSAEAKIGKHHFCRRCWRQHPYRIEKCASCGKHRSTHVLNKLKEPICQNCNNQDTTKYQNCSNCGNFKKVYARDEFGKPLCRKKACRKKMK